METAVVFGLGALVGLIQSKCGCGPVTKSVEKVPETTAAVFASKSVKSVLVHPNNPVCFMDVAVEGQELGRILVELRSDVVPRTAENFRKLCLGSTGVGYSGNRFHRVIPGFMMQGGDFERSDGTGGRSIYGRMFGDENFTLKHDAAGLLAMANRGPNTNGSQFYITFANNLSHLNNKHVVFGRVIDGMDVVKSVEVRGVPCAVLPYSLRIHSAVSTSHPPLYIYIPLPPSLHQPLSLSLSPSSLSRLAAHTRNLSRCPAPTHISSHSSPQMLGTRTGTPRKEIVIVRCGQLEIAA